MALSIHQKSVKTSAKILIGEFDSILWIRVEGRGTFQISPPIKDLVEKEMSSGRSQFVIDLQDCPGMDSTFMGMMAGIGMRLRKRGSGQLSIVGTSEKSRDSLEELGLSYLMEIEPGEGPWMDHIEEIRKSLCPLGEGAVSGKEEHILECHENLCDADDSNTERFKTVLEVMGSDKVKVTGETSD
ncbi:STAS domain-containing protein [Verrucomicrobiaceae bacterium 227]